MQEEGRDHPFSSRGPGRTLEWFGVILEDYFCAQWLSLSGTEEKSSPRKSTSTCSYLLLLTQPCSHNDYYTEACLNQAEVGHLGKIKENLLHRSLRSKADLSLPF